MHTLARYRNMSAARPCRFLIASGEDRPMHVVHRLHHVRGPSFLRRKKQRLEAFDLVVC